MRLACAASFVLLLGSAGIAAATPIEIGAGVGLTQTKTDSDAGADSQQTENLFGRVTVAGPFAAQVEIGHIDQDNTNIRTVNALGIFELGHGKLVPMILFGGGVDNVGDSNSDGQTYTRLEAGLGLELRTRSGLVVGFDVRDGSRSGPPIDEPVATGRKAPLFVPSGSTLATGEYRTMRLTVGVRF